MMGIKFFRLNVLSVSLLALTAGIAHAQQAPMTPQPASSYFNATAPAPDISNVSVFTNITKSGAKIFYLGERSGVYGWFIVKDGQIQMIYMTADKKTTFVGGMFTTDGENVTSKQITQLVENNNEVKTLLEKSAREKGDILKAGAQEGGATSVPSASQPSSSKEGSALPAAISSPGERLYADLEAAAGVFLGRSEGPQIQMVVAPSCPNCKKTWAELRPYVKEGGLGVRLIPVYNTTGEEEKNAAAQLLRAKDPLATWDAYVSGDTSALAGAPDPVAVRAITGNLGLVAKWNIQGYPYLVYRAKDGRIKIVQGRPERMSAVLADIVK